MQIRNFIRESFNDFPGKTSSVVFTPECNYRCPSCHAKHLLGEGKNIDEKEFFDYLDSRKGWIEGVVICGGEPTLQHTLPYFLEKIKKRNLAVKLDTNGSEYTILEDLLGSKLVDYVAMDVKGPPQLYADLTGQEFIDERDGYQKAIAVVSQFPDYEFRTTVAPVVRKNGISFMTPEEIGETAKLIYDCTGKIGHKYFLQPFLPYKGKGELVDSRFEEFPETSRELLEQMKKEARKYLPKCDIR
jgi:pyruvate formate lyase activating enzyme